MARHVCAGCSTSYPMTELHIDPQTSEWYCDPCYHITMLERIGKEDTFETEDWDSDESSD